MWCCQQERPKIIFFCPRAFLIACLLCVCVCVIVCIYSHMQCMSIILCTPSHFSHIQLFVTLWTVTLPRFLCPWDSPGKNTGSGLPFPTPGALSNPGIKPVSLTSPALAGEFFSTSTTSEAYRGPNPFSKAKVFSISFDKPVDKFYKLSVYIFVPYLSTGLKG